MTSYEEKIKQAFDACIEASDDRTTSPAEVAKYMSEHGTLAALDSTLDIADQMRDMRNRGIL